MRHLRQRADAEPVDEDDGEGGQAPHAPDVLEPVPLAVPALVRALAPPIDDVQSTFVAESIARLVRAGWLELVGDSANRRTAALESDSHAVFVDASLGDRLARVSTRPRLGAAFVRLSSDPSVAHAMERRAEAVRAMWAADRVRRDAAELDHEDGVLAVAERLVDEHVAAGRLSREDAVVVRVELAARGDRLAVRRRELARRRGDGDAARA
jgi:hypothetical protein